MRYEVFNVYTGAIVGCVPMRWAAHAYAVMRGPCFDYDRVETRAERIARRIAAIAAA